LAEGEREEETVMSDGQMRRRLRLKDYQIAFPNQKLEL
jgi:hypothetical protein